MRTLCLLFLIGLAVAADKNVDDAFRARREYTYRYVTQVSTGNEPSSHIFTGFKMSALARVQFITYGVVRVSFDDITLYNLEQPVVQYEADKNLHPSTDLREMVGTDALVIKKYLKISFGWTYDDGHVKSIHLKDEETWWSANAKRGFISLFEMNLEKRLQINKHVPISSFKWDNNDIYTVMEQSPEGECATVYARERRSPASNEWYVQKTRDYDHCLERPIFANTRSNSLITHDYNKENPLTVQTNIQYNLRTMGRKKFIITNVVAEEVMTFSPYTEKLLKKDQGEFKTLVNQTLILLDSRRISDTAELPEIVPGKHKASTLRVTLPARQVDIQNPFSKDYEEPQQISNKFDVYSWEKIYTMLRMVAENNIEVTSIDGMGHLRVLSDMITTSPKTVLVQLWNKLKLTRSMKDPVDKLAARVFFELMASVSTEPCADMLLDICTHDITLNSNCSWALNRITLKATVTPSLIRKLVELINERRRTFTTWMKRSAYLTLGSFGYKWTMARDEHAKELDKAEELLTPLLKENSRVIRSEMKKRVADIRNDRKEMINKYNQISDLIVQTLSKLVEQGNTDDKVLGLKALSNSGLPMCARVLKKIIYNHNEPQFIRIMAVLGYRRFTHDMDVKMEAIETLFNVFSDPKETHEIRNMAFVVLVNLKPTLPILEKMAVSMNHEKDSDVSSFVLGYLETVANSTVEPIWRWSLNCTRALKSAPHYKSGYEHSFFKYMGKYMPEYKWGQAVSVTSIRSSPRYEGWALNLDYMFYGTYNHYFEVGMNTVGLGPFINKLFGPRGLITSNKSVFDLLKRKPRDISPQDIIQKIFKDLRIKPRDSVMPSGHIYFKMMGHELGYWDLSTMLRDMTAAGKEPLPFDTETMSMGIPFTYQSAFFVNNEKLTLPSTAGFPISLRLQQTLNVNVEGKWAFKVSPYLLEEQRQGRPPLKAFLDFEMNPKMNWGFYGSMGLDAFFTKTSHGFYSFAKTDTPVKERMSLDMANNKMTFWHTMPKQQRPWFEFMAEPVSERYTITTTKDTPAMIYEWSPVSAPEGERVKPLYFPYSLDSLGYDMEVTGQLPRCWGDLWLPLQGRTVINYFMKPKDNAASVLTFRAHLVNPWHGPEPTSYARSYQEVMQKERDVYGKDTSDMDEDVKYDRYGKPLPTNLNDILPPSEPIDLEKETITMHQLVKKLEDKLGKPVPRSSRSQQMHGLIFTLDATTRSVIRKWELYTMWSTIWSGQIKNFIFHFHREPLAGVDTESWDFTTEMNMKYPFRVARPLDVFSVQWQRKLLKDLKYHMGFDSTQWVNTILNQTVLSVIQQTNFAAWKKITAYRTLEGLIPQHLSNMWNMTDKIFPKFWNKYWNSLIPMWDEMVEEGKLSLDPYFSSREGMLLNKLREFIKIQEDLEKDFREIIREGHVNHGELPIMHWLLLKQGQVSHIFKSVVWKDFEKGMIEHMPVFKKMLSTTHQNCIQLCRYMKVILTRVNALSQEKDQDGKPIIVTRTPAEEVSGPRFTITKDTLFPRDYDTIKNPNMEPMYDSPEYLRTDEDFKDRFDDEDKHEDESGLSINWELRNNLYKLCLHQMDVIMDIETKYDSHDKIDNQLIEDLIHFTRWNVTFFDRVFKQFPIKDKIVVEELMLASVQNEYILRILHDMKEWKALWHLTIEPMSKKSTLDWGSDLESLVFKLMSQDIASRASYVYKAFTSWDIVKVSLKKSEKVIWSQIQKVKRGLFVDMRWFDLWVAHNMTTLKNPSLADPLYKTFISKINNYLLTLNRINSNLISVQGVPPLYIVTELMECIVGLKNTVEYARWSILPVTYHQRFDWIVALGKQTTAVQTLQGKMWPLWEKFVVVHDQKTRRIPVLNNIPVDMRIMDVQDVITQQAQMLHQLRRFVQTSEVPRDVQQKVMDTVVDRIGVLQVSLKQSKVEVLVAVEQHSDYERTLIASVFYKAVSLQRETLELVKTMLGQRSSILDQVSDLTEKASTLEYQLSSLEDELNEKLYDLRSAHKEMEEDVYNDDYSRRFESQHDEPDYSDLYHPKKTLDLQPLTPRFPMPTGIVGLVNMTWGSGNVMNKNAIMQIMALRSVEQVFRIYKELNSVVRSQELVSAVNWQLQGRTFEHGFWHVMSSLNTFNHIHTIFKVDPTFVPLFLRKYAMYTQDRLKMNLWERYELEEPVVNTGEKEIHTVFDLSDFNMNFDMYLMIPSETNKFMDVPLNKWVSKLLPNKGSSGILRRTTEFLSADKLPPMCYVTKDFMQSFDQVTFKLPRESDSCEHLLTMDCSHEKTFAVTMVKSNSSFEGHILRIANDDKLIEVHPHTIDVQVKVNKEILILKEDKPVTFSKQLEYDLYDPSVIITRRGLEITIELPETGVYIKIKGSSIEIRTSMVFKDRLCGLCSNYDGQKSWEYEGPLREVYANPTSFVKSYVMPSPQCPLLKAETPEHLLPQLEKIPPPMHPEYFKGSQTYRDVMEPFDRLKGGEYKYDLKDDQEKDKDRCEPEKVHDIKMRKRRTQVCISKEPVDKCPFDCSEKVDVKRQKVHYICVDSRRAEVPQLRNDISHGKINWDDYPEVKSVRTRQRRLRLPTKCREPRDD